MIKQFTILGERNSGTHFLQYAMTRNFEIEYIRGPQDKHFFGFTEPLSNDDMLTICIFRHPVDWIDSYFKRLHFLPKQNRINIEAFISNEFYSVKEDGTEIMEDRNYITGERYKNIFELRKTKHDYLLNSVPKKVKNVYILKYEDLRDNFENVIMDIQAKFGLNMKNDFITKIEKYKGTYNALYELKPILLNDEIKQKILDNVDREQDKCIGYE